MVDWGRAMKALRRRRGKRNDTPRPLPLGPGEVAGSQDHLQSLLAQCPAFQPAPESRVVVGEAGLVGVAVEGCMAVPGGGIALRGWLADPHGQIASLWMDIDGTLRPVNLSGRMYRTDVLEQRGLLEDFPGHRTGWSIFETCDLHPGQQTTVNLHAVTRTPDGFVVLTSGIKATAGHDCSLERLIREFETGLADASAIAVAALPLLKGLASARRQIAWRDKRIEATSGEPADLAVVVAVNDNADMLYHLLAALEVCRNAGKLEVILSLQSPDIEGDVSECVQAWRGTSPFAAIKSLVPVRPIGFGLAVSGGIAFARSSAIALASDEVLPPNGDWVGTALDLLAKDPQGVLIPAIATFDHRPFTFASVFAPVWAEFAHNHSGLADLAALTPVRKATAWSSGFLVANRDVLETAGGLDDSLSEMDICLFELVLRMQLDGTATLQFLPGAFTHLRLPPYTAGDRVQRLWSLYALAESIRRRLDDTAQYEEQDAESDTRRQDQGEAVARQGKARSGQLTGW